MAEEPPPPCEELDQASVRMIASLCDETAFKSMLSVSKRWLSVCLDPSLPFWTDLSADRWALLGDAPFCVCGVTRACRRLSRRLRSLGTRGVRCCPACRKAPEDGDAACTAALWQTLLLTGCPRLEVLDFSQERGGQAEPLRDAVFLNAVASLDGRPPPLPSLRRALFHGQAQLDGSFLPALFSLAPSLEELGMAWCVSVQARHMPALALHRCALRVNGLDSEPLPKALDISCGVCGSRLWRRLASYCLLPPTQGHIERELFTSVPPEKDALRHSHGQGLWHAGDAAADGPIMLNCTNNCHEQHRLYLVDAGGGNVALHGYAFAIAVGDGRKGRHLRPTLPALARAVAST
jgi:hypothetical protein